MTKELHYGLPVAGYKAQPTEAIKLVNQIKVHEQRLMNCIKELMRDPASDPRWLTIARTQLQLGYMALNRAIFNPGEIDLNDPKYKDLGI